MPGVPVVGIEQLGRVHFLGLAGVGVSAVARLMLSAGVPISGTDAKDLPVLDEFRAAGVPVRVGYAAENLVSVEQETGERIDTIVASSVAQAGTNPEFDAAAAAGKRLLHRSEGLAACMAAKRGIAIAGTHGKTTTSSMVAAMLHHAGTSPSFAIGATVAGFGTNAAAGSGQWFVAEADESDGTLLNYAPEIAVVTNVEADHLDHYGTAEAVHQIFADFAERILPGGALILCIDDPGAASLAEKVRSPLTARNVELTTYGTAPEADLTLTELTTGSTGVQAQLHSGSQRAQLQLPVPGVHNARNAAAAVAVGLYCGLQLSTAAAGVASFRGSSRRFEWRGTVDSIRVYDDYAHHPTEVTAVLAAARSAADTGRVHAIFQPHLFSRTRAFATEFGTALGAADTVRVLEIYPAREEPIPGVSSELLGHPVRTRAQAVEEIVQIAEPGDVVLTLGAGDITELGPQIVSALQRSRTHADRT
nr:UDP-N-acetylmuramate--L-alanine ligase [Nesterenkonia alba]